MHHLCLQGPPVTLPWPPQTCNSKWEAWILLIPWRFCVHRPCVLPLTNAHNAEIHKTRPTGTHCLEDMEKLTVLLLHVVHCSRGKNNVWETSGGQQDLSKGHWEAPDKSLCLIVLPRGVRPFKKEKSSHWVIMRTQHPGKGRWPQWCAGSSSEP